MKNLAPLYLGLVLFIISAFYLTSRVHFSYQSEHSTLNDENMQPDLYLSNVVHYAKEDTYDRCIFHLDHAIVSLKNMELDIDVNSGLEMESVIDELIAIKHKMEQTAEIPGNINAVFEKTLNILTKAELRVSEHYAEINRADLAQLALKYARLHLKNAMQYSDLPNREFEIHVYEEMDSLIAGNQLSTAEMTLKIDHMIAEMNDLITKEASVASH